eukprot:309705-Alexandrium_andersonii.AAC.1
MLEVLRYCVAGRLAVLVQSWLRWSGQVVVDPCWAWPVSGPGWCVPVPELWRRAGLPHALAHEVEG